LLNRNLIWVGRRNRNVLELEDFRSTIAMHAYRFHLNLVKARLALPDFDGIAVRVADVAACLAVFVETFGEKFRSAAFPKFVAPLNICDANIHKTTNQIGIGPPRSRRINPTPFARPIANATPPEQAVPRSTAFRGILCLLETRGCSPYTKAFRRT
jgi:hypothetical protein